MKILILLSFIVFAYGCQTTSPNVVKVSDAKIVNNIEFDHADIFADFVNQQDMRLLERQPRHQFPGHDQQYFLAFLELGRCNCFDTGSLAVTVFDDPNAGGNRALGK